MENKKKLMIKNSAIISLLLCLMLFLNGCVNFSISSPFKRRDIKLDGKDDEWIDSMVRVGSFSLGVCNDEEFFYICISLTDKRTKAQVMGLFEQEFSIWFDENAKQKRSFGLRFSNDSPLVDESLVNRMKYLRVQSFQVIADQMMNNLVVEVMENNTPVALLPQVKGIDVASGSSLNGRKLTYELRIPLKETEEHPYAITTGKDKTFYIGFETSALDQDFVKREIDKAYKAGAMDTQGMQSGRGQRNLPPGLSEDLLNFSRIQLWGKVKLSRAALP